MLLLGDKITHQKHLKNVYSLHNDVKGQNKTSWVISAYYKAKNGCFFLIRIHEKSMKLIQIILCSRVNVRSDEQLERTENVSECNQTQFRYHKKYILCSAIDVKPANTTKIII